jgi:superfamily I DNA/RNA helicase
MAAGEQIEHLLSDLNPPQRAAVTHGDGPLLILAGAGSGKTRVLTHRIAYLNHTGAARANEILAITFTNKAAQEMRERVEGLLGRRTRAMWVMTFHAACARMLRVEAERLGYTRRFTIYDQADARRLVKRCLDDLSVDPRRFTPAAVHNQISDAKNKLRDAEAYGELIGSYFEQTVAEAYRLYERELLRMNAMDFDDLLVRAVNVLELFEEVRDRYGSAFRHILVDEYQDTNHAQYRWLQLLTTKHRNLAVVGDDAQCLVRDTQVTMGDGSRRPIQDVEAGDEVMSCHGGGDFRPARVMRTHRDVVHDLIAITTASGREIVSTPEHVHFAGYVHGCGRRGRRRRALTLTLCDARRGRRPLHRLSLVGCGPVAESTHADFGTAVRAAARIQAVVDVPLRPLARLGTELLPFLQASGVRPGMCMVDEHGDLDPVTKVERREQPALVHDLDVEHTHNFVAGGLVTHNSIYSFRGADISNILSFESDHPDATVIKLEQNYRSTQTILDAANALIAHNREQKPKALWTDAGRGDPITVRELDDEHSEARYVVGEIDRLVDEGGSLSEIAVFYRTNAMSRVIEDTLVRREIGYQVVGGTKFYDRAEIKDAIAYLLWLNNPQDVISFSRIANSPKRGIGQTSLARVLSHADTIGASVWEVAEQPGSVPGLGTAAVKAFTRFMEAMNGLRERAADGVPVGDLLEAVLDESGYLGALEAERTIEAEGRIENLRALVEGAREFDAVAEEGEDDLDAFLQQVALQSDADTRRDDEGIVTLMTLHNAKGLEYPVVFVIGCEEGVFPHSRALDEGGLEEERRLAYVGVTRAQRRLVLTHARRRNVFGAQTYGLKSRFIDELPAEVTDREEPTVRAGAGAGAGSWASAAAGTAARAEERRGAGGGAGLRLGDDVVHAAFGDGVITGVEPGGIVVVRFASDGSERKLMADFAPISKR